MRTCSFLLLLLATPNLIAQTKGIHSDKQNIFPEKMLYKYLQREAGKYFDARRKKVASLQNEKQIQLRQARLKKLFIAALGGFPKKTPLNAKVVGKIEKDKYRIEKVIYESQPNHHVTAILYLPNGKGPFPGVLVPCGHSSNGKASGAYQRISIFLAMNGIATLCYDPIGQGERKQLVDDKGTPLISSSTTEHTMVGVGALLVGKSAATYRIWDGIRSLDYLAGRPEVDAKRLGCTGNSGGGTLTAYLMALDERIVAAAPSCYITSLERLFATIGPQDAEQNITGQVAFGMEHADYVTMRAPRPTLICVATKDFFDIDGAWTTFREAKLLYGKLGYGERVSLFEFNDGHGFSRPRRQAALRWMRRWLLKKDDAVFEPDFPIFTDEQLQCTRSGQALHDFRGVSAFQLNVKQEKKLQARRKLWHQFNKTGKQFRAKVRQLIALPGTIQAAKLQLAGEQRPLQFLIRECYFETEPGILVPGTLTSQRKASKKLLLVVNGNELEPSDRAKQLSRIGKLVKAGIDVLVLDLRGMGKSSPKRKRGLAKYFGSEWQESFLALHLGRPLLGQRVYDLLSVAEWATKAGKYKDLSLLGIASGGPIVLHAGALDSRFGKITVEESVASWSKVVKTPVSYNQLANVVPGALEFYDLPDLSRLIEPRELTVRNRVESPKKSNGKK